MRCEFCNVELLRDKPTFRVTVDVNTLEPCGRSGGVRYYFCSTDCKTRWLASPKDECIVCRRSIRTDVASPIVRHVERGGYDFYVCGFPTFEHSEWSKKIDLVLVEVEGLNQTEPIIRAVKVLRGRARDEADRMELEPDDLVIVTASLHPLPEYHIEKVEGAPVSFLLKQSEEAGY